MGKLFIAIFWLLCWSCSSGSSNLDVPGVPLEHYQAPEYQIFLGEVLLLHLPHWPSLSVKKLICRDKEIPFYLQDEQIISFVSESYFSDLSNFSCRFVFDDGKEKVVANFKVLTKKYPQEYLKVAPQKVTPSAVDQKRIAKEQKMLNEIYNNFQIAPFFVRPFQKPINSMITSDYGHRRIFNHKKMGQHLGVDFRAAIGTKIYPANRGKVVFVGDLFYTGNTVIVDHGLGIFTIYAHLSSISTKIGDLIDVTSEIGTAGMTGRVSGPHLHWGVKINHEWINGLSLINETKDWVQGLNVISAR